MDRAPVFGTGCWGFESLLGHHRIRLSKAKRGEILPALFGVIQPNYSQTFRTLWSELSGLLVLILLAALIFVLLLVLVCVAAEQRIQAVNCLSVCIWEDV